MKTITFFLFLFIFFKNINIFAQLEISGHIGRGQSAVEINNISTVVASRFEQYKIQRNLLDPKGLPKYYEASVKYYLKNSFAINLIYNSSSSYYWISFRDFKNGFYLDPKSTLYTKNQPSRTSSFSFTLSRDLKISSKLFLIPETGVGLINYRGPTFVLSKITQRLLKDERYIDFEGNLIKQRVSDGLYIPISAKLSWQLATSFSVYLVAGNQITLSGFHAQDRIEYKYSLEPNATGIAEYNYKNFKYFAFGASVRILDQ